MKLIEKIKEYEGTEQIVSLVGVTIIMAILNLTVWETSWYILLIPLGAYLLWLLAYLAIIIVIVIAVAITGVTKFF